jgi:hypothetical protein
MAAFIFQRFSFFSNLWAANQADESKDDGQQQTQWQQAFPRQ